MVALEQSTSVDKSKQLLKKITDLKPIITGLKTEYGLSPETIKKLSDLKFEGT